MVGLCIPAAETPHFSGQTSSAVLLPSPAGTILGACGCLRMLAVKQPISSANMDHIEGATQMTKLTMQIERIRIGNRIKVKL